MKKLIGMTTVMIVFLVLMLGPSVELYRENPQDYSWIDVNGEFKEDSYDLVASYNLDTPLEDLNGYSLKEVFEDHNEYYEKSHFNAYQCSYVETDYEFLVTTWNVRTSTQPAIWSDISGVTGDKFYTRADFLVIDSQIDLVGWRFNNTSVPFLFLQTYDVDIWYSISANPTQSQSSFTRTLMTVQLPTTTTGQFQYRVKNIVGMNLTDLGIDLTKDQMDYYYRQYQSLQENKIENYKVLGGEVESQWTEFNIEYLQPILNITGLYIDLLIDPLGFVGDLFENIVIIPTIG